MQPRIRSVHAGMPETFVAPDGTTMTSAVRKRRIDGPVAIGERGLEGDGTTSPYHSAIHVHVFPHDHYPWFEGRAGRPLQVPLFGENLSVTGIDEEDVRVGDAIRAGTVTLVVTQPTIRCATLGHAAGLPKLLEWIQERLATGFYCRVETPGRVAAGDAWETVRRGRGDLTIANLNRTLLRAPLDEPTLARLEAVPELSSNWKESARRRFTRQQAARA